MHELAIANSIVNTVLKQVEKQNLGRVNAVGLRIGALSDVVPEALEFGFSAIIAGTALEGARLKIENVPVLATCTDCAATFGVKELVFACPECRSRNVELEQGQELDIVYIEVETR
ncbi:MAG: hydrogenase maturation nickel metallochaperone HypA [Candidatus Zixiibacteriota bacterium]